MLRRGLWQRDCGGGGDPGGSGIEIVFVTDQENDEKQGLTLRDFTDTIYFTKRVKVVV